MRGRLGKLSVTFIFGLTLTIGISGSDGSINGASPGPRLPLGGLDAIEPPPGFFKVFNPDTIAAGTTTRLLLFVSNASSSVSATALAFTDNLPAGVVVASPPNLTVNCIGGTATALSGAGVVSYTGGSVPAGFGCSLGVDVTAAASGVYVNTTGDLTSSLGNSGTATDTLTVTTAVPVLPSGWLLALAGILMLGGGAWALRRRATMARTATGGTF